MFMIKKFSVYILAILISFIFIGVPDYCQFGMEEYCCDIGMGKYCQREKSMELYVASMSGQDTVADSSPLKEHRYKSFSFNKFNLNDEEGSRSQYGVYENANLPLTKIATSPRINKKIIHLTRDRYYSGKALLYVLDGRYLYEYQYDLASNSYGEFPKIHFLGENIQEGSVSIDDNFIVYAKSIDQGNGKFHYTLNKYDFISEEHSILKYTIGIYGTKIFTTILDKGTHKNILYNIDNGTYQNTELVEIDVSGRHVQTRSMPLFFNKRQIVAQGQLLYILSEEKIDRMDLSSNQLEFLHWERRGHIKKIATDENAGLVFHVEDTLYIYNEQGNVSPLYKFTNHQRFLGEYCYIYDYYFDNDSGCDITSFYLNGQKILFDDNQGNIREGDIISDYDAVMSSVPSEDISSFAYDMINQKVFWYNQERRIIYTSDFNFSRVSEIINLNYSRKMLPYLPLDHKGTILHSLAYDPYASTLFFINSTEGSVYSLRVGEHDHLDDSLEKIYESETLKEDYLYNDRTSIAKLAVDIMNRRLYFIANPSYDFNVYKSNLHSIDYAGNNYINVLAEQKDYFMFSSVHYDINTRDLYLIKDNSGVTVFDIEAFEISDFIPMNDLEYDQNITSIESIYKRQYMPELNLPIENDYRNTSFYVGTNNGLYFLENEGMGVGRLHRVNEADPVEQSLDGFNFIISQFYDENADGFPDNYEVCTEDFDKDGVEDCFDKCPDDPEKLVEGICGCGSQELDSDSDGTYDCDDKCSQDPDKIEPGICGCGVDDTDTDHDGVANCLDECPEDINKSKSGICGCGVADIDADEDGIADCIDECSEDINKSKPGICGCGVSDLDTDGDGTVDCIDECSKDLSKTSPGICGCGVADTDTDNDGVVDCLDKCIEDPNKSELGSCGCGIADVDNNNNGIFDCLLLEESKHTMELVKKKIKKGKNPVRNLKELKKIILSFDSNNKKALRLLRKALRQAKKGRYSKSTKLLRKGIAKL